MSGTARHCYPPSRQARRRASGAAASIGVALLLLAGLPALAQEVGDFGRLKPGFVNDEIVPLLQDSRRGTNGRPLDGFNLTDQEVEMRDRVWRFLVAPHAKDWAWPSAAEIRPAKARQGSGNHVAKYYLWLTSQRYASSRVRFNTIADHAAADIGTLPATFGAICAVIGIDRQRSVSVGQIPDLEPVMAARQQKRDGENNAFIDRFVLALNFRYNSYSYALDHFLVETPHEEAVDVDAALSELVTWVDRANAHDFCGDTWSIHADGEVALPSRVLLDPPKEAAIPK